MTKKLFFAIFITILLSSCTSLPEIKQAADLPEFKSPFAPGKWQYVHSLEASMKGDNRGMLMGVTMISHEDRSIRSVIMTLEGLVLFDAGLNNELTVHRGVPPFDSHDFALGLMKDINLIFFEPIGKITEKGYTKKGYVARRYMSQNGIATDVIDKNNGEWILKKYGKGRSLKREVVMTLCEDPHGQHTKIKPCNINLNAYGFGSYRLVMELMSAESLKEHFFFGVIKK